MEEKNTSYSLSDEELREIEEMSIEELLASVRKTIEKEPPQKDSTQAKEETDTKYSGRARHGAGQSRKEQTPPLKRQGAKKPSDGETPEGKTKAEKKPASAPEPKRGSAHIPESRPAEGKVVEKKSADVRPVRTAKAVPGGDVTKDIDQTDIDALLRELMPMEKKHEPLPKKENEEPKSGEKVTPKKRAPRRGTPPGEEEKPESSNDLPEKRVVPRKKEQEDAAPEFLRTRRRESMAKGLSETSRRKKKKHRFAVAVISYGLILAAMASGALSVFKSYLEVYESSRPDKAAEDFLASQSDAYWEDMIANCGYIDVTDFEDGGKIAQLCGDAVKLRELCVRRNEMYTEEDPIYTVFAGETPMARLTLRRSKRAGFGLYTWAVSRAEILPEFVPETRQLRITVPVGARITVNGVPVDERYFEGWIEYSGLSELEKSFDAELPGQKVYALDGIYGNVSVIVEDENREAILPDYADGTEYRYDMKFDKTYSVTARLPDGAVLYINGAEIPEAYLTGTVQEERLRGEEQWLPGKKLPETREYTVTELVVPATSVSAAEAGGRALSCTEEDGIYVFKAEADEPTVARKRRIEAFLEAYLTFAEGAGDTSSGALEDVSEFLRVDGELLSLFRSVSESMPTSGAEDVTLEDFDITEYREYGEQCFAVELNAEYTVTRGETETEKELSMGIVFILSGEEWLADKMELAEHGTDGAE